MLKKSAYWLTINFSIFYQRLKLSLSTDDAEYHPHWECECVKRHLLSDQQNVKLLTFK